MSRRKGIMLCYPFEEKRLNKWKPPFIVQPKLDGERCRAIISNEGDVSLLSSEENEIISVPHIKVELKERKDLWGKELDGELYIHGASFEEIHSIVGRTVNLHPNHQEVQYHIFDQVTDQPQFLRSKELSFMDESTYIKTVQLTVVNTLEEIMTYYEYLIKSNYEGIVVRHVDALYIRKRSIYVMKFKPKKDDTYKIVGYNEEVSILGELKDRLGSLICQGSDGTLFSVGSGLSDDQRALYWEQRDELIGKHCHVAYQHITTGKGVPRFPVFIEVVEDEREYIGIR